MKDQRVAAYVVATDGDRLLLSRLSDRTMRPGWWTLPGGGIEFGEHPEAAALRELLEETGLEGRIEGLLAVDSFTGPIEFDDGPRTLHRIRIIYGAEITGGVLRPEADGSSDDAKWFTPSELDEIRLTEPARLGMRLAWPNA